MQTAADTLSRPRPWHALGPGLIFAAAAVGVSHLVQSTRAGADFGLSLIVVVLLANLLKYPAFRFGPEYTAATGLSLLEGYRRQGRWALWLFLGVTVGTMFAVQAGVTVVTAGLALALTGWDLSAPTMSGWLLASCALLLALGRYRLLDKLTKVLVAILTVSTVAATLLVLPQIPWSDAALWWPNLEGRELKTLLFLVALIGWMPSAIDVAAWQSLWTLARARIHRRPPQLGDTLFDFHVGYVGTAALACCFLLMGAGVMYGQGGETPASAGAFAAQVVALYTSTLGAWSGPLIGVAAFVVMFSTTLTVLDGFPRVLSVLLRRFRGPEVAGEGDEGRVYWVAVLVQAAAAVGILVVALRSLTGFIDVATSLSFLTAPVLAWLNHRVRFDPQTLALAPAAPWLLWMSRGGVLFLSAFALLYVGVLLLRPG